VIYGKIEKDILQKLLDKQNTALIFMELNRLHRTLVHTGPTLDTVFWSDGIRFIQLDPIDFTWADLSTVSTALAFLWINYRIHRSKSHRAWCIGHSVKTYTIFKEETLCSMLYALCSMLYALCSMPYALCPMLYALCSMPFALCF
jgi:hypothetical protein